MTGNSGSTDFINDVYGDIYSLGDGCKRAAIAVFKAVGFFFKKIFGIFILIFSFFKKSVSGILKKITNEAVKIITEVKAAVPKILTERFSAPRYPPLCLPFYWYL